MQTVSKTYLVEPPEREPQVFVLQLVDNVLWYVSFCPFGGVPADTHDAVVVPGRLERNFVGHRSNVGHAGLGSLRVLETRVGIAMSIRIISTGMVDGEGDLLGRNRHGIVLHDYREVVVVDVACADVCDIVCRCILLPTINLIDVSALIM